jgi:hypothetical protein
MSDTNASTPAHRAQLSRKLPTFRVGFSKQMDALRAYALLSENGTKPVHYSRVAEIIKVHEANVSSMNPFFLENGIILKASNGHMPSSAVLDYSRAYSWNADTAAAQLRPLIADAWFGAELINHLTFRPLSEDSAIEILAAKCNAGPEAKPQLRILLDFCESSGVIARANGQITLAAVIGPPDLEQPLDSAAAVDPAPEPKPMPLAQPTKRTSDGGITYDVSINVSMAEMKDWTPDRITAFFAGIAQVLAAKNG